jgi:hypothetical protein
LLIRWKHWVRGDVENVDTRILRRLARIARGLTKHYHATGGDKRSRYSIYVNSGFRTRLEQEAAYDRYLRNGFPIAAKPGTSNHEKSPAQAADVNLILPEGRRAAISRARLEKYGLKAPVTGESWHTELL